MKHILMLIFIFCFVQVNAQDDKGEESKKNRKDKTITVEIFQKVDRLPEFPGGSDQLTAYIESNSKFPLTETEKEIDETVHLLFLMRSDGSIDHGTIKVEQSVDSKFDSEAIRLVQSMPNWTPAFSSVVNEEVDVWVRLPVRFQKNVVYK